MLLLLIFLSILGASANLLVVVPIQPSMAYDVQMNRHFIEILESETHLPVLQYAVPSDCFTSEANIYQKHRNLVFDIPCRQVLHIERVSAVV